MWRARFLSLVVAGALACTRGDAVVERMSPAQRDFFETRVLALQKGMTSDAVVAVLGEPTRGAGSPRPCWYAPEQGAWGQVCAYFSGGRLFQVRWLSLWPPWAWERRF